MKREKDSPMFLCSTRAYHKNLAIHKKKSQNLANLREGRVKGEEGFQVFLHLSLVFHILGALVGSLPFVKFFVSKVLQDDLSMIPRVDPQAIFAMLSFCYAQEPSYLQHIVFPSLSTLQHHTN
jgi:hypothetical protein